MIDTVYGSYGCAWPLVALLARTRPPGTTRPDVEPWPAMPVLATELPKLMMKALKSIPFTTGAEPTMLVGAELYPTFNSFCIAPPIVPCSAYTAFDGLSVMTTLRPLTPSGCVLRPWSWKTRTYDVQLVFMRKSRRALNEFSLTFWSPCSCAMSKSGLADAPGRITAPGAVKPGRSTATAGTARDHAESLGTPSTKFRPAFSL